uniref:Secreted protein n=1 Tax=Aegilops tauschii subsp. strangulata TaxID=200361 RepID=A0A453PUZ9_AEGTS
MASYFAKLCRLRHVVLVFIICSVDIPGKDIGGVFLEMWFRKLHDVSAHNLYVFQACTTWNGTCDDANVSASLLEL